MVSAIDLTSLKTGDVVQLERTFNSGRLADRWCEPVVHRIGDRAHLQGARWIDTVAGDLVMGLRYLDQDHTTRVVSVVTP